MRGLRKTEASKSTWTSEAQQKPERPGLGVQGSVGLGFKVAPRELSGVSEEPPCPDEATRDRATPLFIAAQSPVQEQTAVS